MLLQFITEPVISSKDRRLIRSHVMKGKNAGKPRPPRKTLVHLTQPFTNSKGEQLNDGESAKFGSEHGLPLDRLLWNELTLASFPEHVSPETTKFVYHRLWLISKVLFPPEFCSEVNLSQYAWFTYVLEDKAYFNTLLAISSSFNGGFGVGPRCVSPAALKHISIAYRLVSQYLSSAEACSDKAIAAVTILAIYQRMHHQHEVGLVHFAGLRRMIQLRGGLARLSEENRSVAQKPWRLALEFALQDGSPVAFGLEDVPVPLALGSIKLRYGEEYVSPTTYLNPTLQSHLTNISSFTSHLNHHEAKIDPYNYSDAVCIRLHELLDYAPLNHACRQDLSLLEDMVHLSLMAVMSTLMPEYGANQARYDLLAVQLRHALQGYAGLGSINSELFLWVLFVGYATVLSVSDHAWLMLTAGEVCSRLGVVTWKDVHKILCRFAWIGVFYDQAGLKLWNEIDERRSEEILIITHYHAKAGHHF
ncbi:hypothetical protein CC86DRAFT_451075 [Ophiobolus disseminans]|uniref:Transcription factor domain-containing protein n=1 Tax=Ophiobolus disseminans TaxID=1469910 RepID=A0A6A7AL73_9PLEO|nr:hypothetical protein CC86DRAFT_451075 [Ophiobolus disseminans]